MQYISKKKQPDTWENLLLSADSDYVSLIVLAEAGLAMGTSLWLAEQSVEKYLKSWLKKTDPGYKVNKHGHDLVEIWKDAKSICNPVNLKFEDYERFVTDLNLEGDSTDLRYSFGFTIQLPIFFEEFASLGDLLRFELLGEEEYKMRGRSAGLPDSFLDGRVSQLSGNSSEIASGDLISEFVEKSRNVGLGSASFREFFRKSSK